MLIGLYSPTMQSGKSTVADYLVREHGFYKISFAYPIKAMIEVLEEFLGNIDDLEPNWIQTANKDNLLTNTTKSLRYAMQTLGTEWGRNLIDKDLWIKAASASMNFERNVNGHTDFVIDDLRFSNEADWILNHKGFLVKVVNDRIMPKSVEHISEGSLDNWKFNAIIQNNGSLDALYQRTDEVLALLNSTMLI